MEQNDQNKTDLTPPKISFDDTQKTIEFKEIEEEEITLQQLAEWKGEGNYEILEQHIRSGNLEILPRATLEQLVQTQQNFQTLIHTLQIAQKSILPLLDKGEELSKYVDPDSRIKINIGKLTEEFLSAQNLNPFSKKKPKPLPIVALFQENIRTELFADIPLEQHDRILQANNLDHKITLAFFEQLGFWKKEETTV